jgi:hypothetical protein
MDSTLPQLTSLIETRLLLVRHLADSLEVSRSDLLANDVEAIARGAAHQAELCRQWSRLEDQVRRAREQSPALATDGSPEGRRLPQLQQEWDELSVRIRHLSRVHLSLLRHLNRSLAVLARVVESCAPTYRPEPSRFRTEAGSPAGD